ncbi:uncharacterized protein NMK_2696 [Novimethylophilus kurashikiensis]|uniref:Diguanylate cyclase n=1 Tax=Novimethylophilus kurashikiensis TaxID=1825523 RepID=A0A2R5FE95_9PROT|nr:diguanylate cyclase [Novimethylophilus kurashikiensis]GBG15093.1 uncharacterized protein NMK_2696 [Novimethylophilus kurashikiensis]
MHQLSKISMDMAYDAILWLALDGSIVYSNFSASRYLGYSEEELTQLTIFDLDPNYPREVWPQHVAEHKQKKSVSLESKHLTKDGRMIDVEISCNYVEWDGQEYFCSIVRDITERKESDNSLKLASLIYSETSQAMLVTDQENEIIAINPAFTALTGYAWDEVLGKNPKFLSSGRQDKSFYDSMWESLHLRGTWQGEIWNRRKNGEIYPEWLSINTVYDEKGAVYRRIALFTDITEIKKSEELIWNQANYDALTGLPNRRMTLDRLDFEIKKSRRENLPLVVLFIDLDGFKEVNDTFGHDIGDQLLIEVSQRILKCVRESDTLGRIGGDEFVVILGEVVDIDSTDRILKEMLNAISEPYLLQNHAVTISASIGLALFPDDSEDASTLLKSADKAMYEAKHRGKNQHCWYSELKTATR